MVEAQDNPNSIVSNEVVYKGVTIYAPGGDKRVGFTSSDVMRINQLCESAFNGSLGTTKESFLQRGTPIAEQVTGYKNGTNGLLNAIWTQVEARRFQKETRV